MPDSMQLMRDATLHLINDIRECGFREYADTLRDLLQYDVGASYGMAVDLICDEKSIAITPESIDLAKKVYERDPDSYDELRELEDAFTRQNQ